MSNGSRYAFVTEWDIDAPVERVWDALFDPELWPTWWRGVERVVTLRPGAGALGTGAIRRYTWKSKLPYRLTFTMETTKVEEFRRIEGHATGELEGFGCWQFTSRGAKSHVRYDWQVVANKWWMIWLAPIARPLFEWNHDAVMEWGRQGLVKRISEMPH